MKNSFTPKLWTVIRHEGLNTSQLFKDIGAGVTVGIVALPLAIAFAIASGVQPGQGIITAVVGGLIISALGGSRVQIGGPTGAFVVIVFGIVAEFGVEGLTIATLMAGMLIVIFGLLRLGDYLRFIPFPLIVGFTSGIAVLIFTSQINDLLGLGISEVPAEFFEKWSVYAGNIGNISLPAVFIALLTLAISLIIPRIFPRVPGSIFGIVIATAAVAIFKLPVETIQDRFGDVRPEFMLPDFRSGFSFREVISLFPSALAIAILGSIESLLSAVVADGMIGSRHRPNMELLAQGTANIASALLGGIPATGAIARTVTNIRNGGRTPIAGIIHAVTLLLIMLVLSPLAKLIPMASLAGIMVLVAWNMSERKQFASLLRSHPVDILILLVTFVLTVVFDLIIAIEVGMVLSSLLFMKRMGDSLVIRSEQVRTESIRSEADLDGCAEPGMDLDSVDENDSLTMKDFSESPDDLLIYEINGPLFFGAVAEFQDVILKDRSHPSRIIIRMRYVPFIDATGYQRLATVLKTFSDRNIEVMLSGVGADLREGLAQHGIMDIISEDKVFADFRSALEQMKNNAGNKSTQSL